MGNKVTAVFDSGSRESLQGNPITLIKHEGLVRRFFPFHSHDYYEISLTFRGGHNLYIGGQTIPYGSGDVCIIKPDTLHSIGPSLSGPEDPENDVVWTLKVSPDLVDGNYLKDRQGIVVPIGENADFIEKNLELLLEALREEDIRWPLVRSLSTLILELIRLQILGTKKAPVATDASDEYLREILDYISLNHRENLTVESLTRRFAVSRSSLMRMFQDNLGITPINYRIDWQVVDACGLLLKTDLSIQQIAEELGFQNVYYFSTLFRKRMQVSPSHFRHQYTYESFH